MTPHQKAALEFIHDYYFLLPNNGSLNEGINSCEARYREATYCALVCVKKIIEALEAHSWQNRHEIEHYNEVQSELFKIQAGNSAVSLDELLEIYKK